MWLHFPNVFILWSKSEIIGLKHPFISSATELVESFNLANILSSIKRF